MGEQSNFFYKTMITQIMDGKIIGKTILTDNYDKQHLAFREGERYKVSDLSVIEVRQYNKDNQTNIISFDEQDTGKMVIKDVSGIRRAVQDYYLEESEVVFSEMIGFILEHEDDEFHDIVSLLSEEDINYLLSWSGDNEWVKYENGEIIILEENIEADKEETDYEYS